MRRRGRSRPRDQAAQFLPIRSCIMIRVFLVSGAVAIHSPPMACGMGILISAGTFRAATLCLSALLAGGVHAEGIDTEHIFGFMIGTDVGNVGEREFRARRPDDLPKMAEITARSVRNLNSSSCL